MELRPGPETLPNEVILRDHQTVNYELMLISRDRETDVNELNLIEQFYDDDQWYDSLMGRVAAREWVINRIRLARSPRITRECCLRVAIEYLVPRRLRTTTLENVSCSALFDWNEATFTEHESHSML
eukprot:8338139-Pyramimonas_sp.AAC.1